MVTYEQAYEAVREELEPEWNHGTFCIDDREIVENEEVFVFEVGAREYFVDGDRSFEAVGGVTVVYKSDGQVGSLPSVTVATDPTMTGRPNPDPASGRPDE